MNLPKEWVRARFTIDGELEYEGWYNPRARWNGWAMPFFDRETVAAIVGDLESFDFNSETMELLNLIEPEEWRENELIEVHGLYMFNGWTWAEVKKGEE